MNDPREATYAPAPERKTVAVVYDKDGNKYDEAWTWQTGQNYASQGYRVVAVADDGYMTKNEAQELYDYELKCFKDCFNRDHYFEED